MAIRWLRHPVSAMISSLPSSQQTPSTPPQANATFVCDDLSCSLLSWRPTRHSRPILFLGTASMCSETHTDGPELIQHRWKFTSDAATAGASMRDTKDKEGVLFLPHLEPKQHKCDVDSNGEPWFFPEHQTQVPRSPYATMGGDDQSRRALFQVLEEKARQMGTPQPRANSDIASHFTNHYVVDPTASARVQDPPPTAQRELREALSPPRPLPAQRSSVDPKSPSLFLF
mmetsp:Transcript_43465/g.102254  ORF Transcript_43465/g.102254 Transcript_43465/m.102254 type:complete len:229 (+) Transcript_43465:413-1099(+)